MMTLPGIWLAIPVKQTDDAKQRLTGALPAVLRRELALAMLEDVLAAAARATGLAGIMLITADEAAGALAARFGARVLAETTPAGQTDAVAAAAKRLAAEGCTGLLTLPGDIPLVSPAEITELVAHHPEGAGFSIVPAHDLRGSNAVLCSPPGFVPLRFGNDSFYPHLAAARACGLEPRIERLPGIALDIDKPSDLESFMAKPSPTRAYALLARHGITRMAQETNR